MVFESLVTDLLNRYLGEYVENLDTSQLKLGIWGGDAVLANLDVRQGALDELDLPVKIKHGHLDKLTLRIPWKNLYTEPVVVDIDGLYVVAVPNVGVDYDEKRAKKEEQDAKQKELTRIEEVKAAQMAKSGPEKQDSFAEKMATQVIKNLQVRIGQIHIRYEDKFTTPKHPFSIGVTLESLSFQTTDQTWMPCVVKEAVTTICKMVKLNNLSLYWNSRTDLISDLPKDKLKAELITRIAKGSQYYPPNINYLVKPINSEVKLTLNTKPEKSDFSLPKVLLNVMFEEIAVHLGKLQYHDIMNMLESFERMTLIGIYRKYGRPAVPAKQVKPWWRYAYRSILEGTVRRRRRMWSWEHIKEHRDTTRRYKKLWQKKVQNKKLSQDELNFITDCEQKLDVFNITMTRQLAEIAAKKAPSQEESGGWFGGWWGSGKKETKNANDIQKEFSKAMSGQEKEKLYQAIGYQENATADVTLPKDYEAHKVLFRLNTLSVSLDDPDLSCPQVLQLTLQDVFAAMDQRPSADAFKLNLKIDSLKVGGSPSNGSVPTIVTSVNSEADRIFSLLDVSVETNPLDGECDNRVRLTTRPMRIIYDAMTINQVITLFKPPESVRLKQLQAAAMSKFEQLKDQSATGMQHMIDLHKYTEIYVDLRPAHIIIPQNGVFSPNTSHILVSLGNLKVTSEKNEAKKFDGTESVDEVMKRAYDQFQIRLQNIQAVFVQPGADWETALTLNNSPLHVLRPMSLNLTVRKAIIEDIRMPKITVQGDLPLLSVNISDHRLQELLSLAKSIPPPPSDNSEKYEFDDDDGIHPNATARAAEAVLAQVAGPVVTSPSDVAVASDNEGPATKLDAVDGSAQYATDLELFFEVHEISLNLSQRKNGVDVPTLKIVLEALGTRLAVKAFDMELTAYLTAFYVQHLQFRGGVGYSVMSRDDRLPHGISTELNDGPLLNLINTPLPDNSSFRLIIVDITQANKKGPEFATVHQSTEQRIRVNVTGLDVLLHQEAVLNVLEFVKSLTPTSDDGETSEEPADSGGKPASKQITRAGRRRKTDENIINLKVEAKLDAIKVDICDLQKRITEINIRGLQAGVTMMQEKMDVKLTLDELTFIDPIKQSLYPKILASTNGAVFDLAVTVFKNATEGDNYSNMHCVDTDIKVQLGCIRAVFLNRYVTDLLTFLNNFQAAKDTLAEGADKVAESAREQARAIHEKASRVRLDVTMQAPVIVIPQSSLSNRVLIMDLGKLTLNNSFSMADANSGGLPPIMDKMRIELTNVQIMRSILDEAGTPSAVCQLLQPVTVNIGVVRNLSISFYKQKPEIDISGRLAAVMLELSQGDFASMMLVLTENLSEAPVKPQTVDATVKARTTSDTVGGPPTTKAAITPAEHTEPQPVFTKLSVSFTLENLAVVLYSGKDMLVENGGVLSRQPEQALAKFQLDTITMNMTMKSDNEMTAVVNLHTCLLDDLRAGAEDRITRMIERAGSRGVEESQMIHINFSQTQTLDKNILVAVNSLYICVCLEFLLCVSGIFTKGLPAPKQDDKTPQLQEAGGEEVVEKRPESDLTIKLTMVDPEIILVDNPESRHTTALILDTQISFLLRQTPDTTKMMGNISQLQIYAAAFEKEKRKINGSKNILNPCDICLNTSSPFNEGQQVALELTDVIINISPQIIRLITQILSALSGQQGGSECTEDDVKSQTDLWDKKNINQFNFWFFKQAPDFNLTQANNDAVAVRKKEEMILAVSAIVIKLEAGVEKRTVPMLIVEAGFDGVIKDWSSSLQMNFDLKCEVAYFNEENAVWEPLLEPVEDGHDHRAWQLSVQLQKQQEAILDLVDGDDETDNVVTQPPKLNIEVKSYDILQLTMTKTCLEVLTNLGKAFNDAYNLKSVSGKGKTYNSPYVIRNTCGMSITVQLDERFEMPPHCKSGIVVIKSGEDLELRNFKTKKMLKKATSAIEMSQIGEERSISFTVEAFKATRSLVIQKAEKRSFNINQQSYPGDIWALICETETSLGTRVVTMRSILQVQNVLPVRIHVFYKNEDGVLDRFGTLEPDETLNVPLHVVYTAPNHIFFKPDDDNYKVSSSGLSWRGLKNHVSELVTCSCMQAGYRPFYFNATPAVSDVFFESTEERTAKVYSVKLSPTVILKNLLPVPIDYILENTAAQLTMEPGERKILFNACAGKTAVEIRLLNYIGRDWDAKVTLDTGGAELSSCTFEAPDGYSTVTMDLGIHTKSTEGFMEISLYAPYWMINKTSMPLQYKSTDETLLDHPADYSDVIMFAFKPSSFSKKRHLVWRRMPFPRLVQSFQPVIGTPFRNLLIRLHRNGGISAKLLSKFGASLKLADTLAVYSMVQVMLRVCDSEWSDKFTVDTVGNSGTVQCKFKTYAYEVGVSISLSASGLTKIVVFTPYYMIVNKAEFTISCCETLEGARWTDVPPNECVPFWPMGTGKKALMKAKVKEKNVETQAFPLNEPHISLLRTKDKECTGLNVDCQIMESSTILILDQYRSGMAPARVINDTQFEIVYTQSEPYLIIDTVDPPENDIFLETSSITDEQCLGPRQTSLYTWQEPTAKRELIWQCRNEKGRNDLLRDDRGHFKIEENEVFWVSFLDGLQRVLLFTEDVLVLGKTQETDMEQVDQDIRLDLQGLGLSMVNNLSRSEVAYLGITSSGVIWEGKRKRYKALRMSQSEMLEQAYQRFLNEQVVNPKVSPRVVLNDGKMEVDFQDMIMYKPTKQLIRRSFEHGISVHYRVSPHQIQFHAKIHRLQLDSMLPGAVFQTILAPVPPPKSVAAESVPKPFTEVSIMVRKNEHSKVLQFRYFHMLTQEMAIKIDQGFLTSLLSLFTSAVSEADPLEEFKKDRSKVSTSLMDGEATMVLAEGQKNFYDDLHFTPLKIHLSFSLHGDDGDEKQQAFGMNIINLFLQSVGIVLTDVQDVVFKLGYFERKYTFFSQDQLLSEIIRHYSGQAIRQMYVLVLGLDVLGNPFGVIRGMAQGLEDLFYEPYQGAIQGPEEFAEGLALGVRSLFGHAIGGAAGAVSRITGTLGKGIATLTMDEDYLRKRREQMNKRPDNVREGLARGGRGLVMGVFDGVTGIVSKPMEGAKKEGVEGFFKGMGKGLVGVIARPASGVVDFASSGFEAMRRAAEMSDEIHRLRPPRYLPPDGIVRPYKFREAEGNNILLETERGKFGNDKYVGHMAVSKDYKHILLITNKRLMMVSKGEIFGQWDCSWFYLWNELREPPCLKARGIQIVLKEKQKKLFGSSTVGKVVQFIDQDQAEWLVDRMQETMNKAKEGL